MGLDFFTAGEREKFTEVCERLALLGHDEKDFYRVNRMGYTLGDECYDFGRPNLSVMRDISPKNYPYFLAVCAASVNKYMREEALRLGAEYPILLSIIINTIM